MCGKKNEELANEIEKKCIFHLNKTEVRKYDIKVYHDKLVIEGEFWNLKDKEFYKNNSQKDVGYIKDFIGIGYLKKKSYRQGIIFVISAFILEMINLILDKVGDIQMVMSLVGDSFELPRWIDYGVNIMLIGCFLLAIRYFFSQKDVVEISFLNKRICVPKNSLSNYDFLNLREIISGIK